MDGTVTRLQSQLGERVLGTSFNKGTEIMTIADLNEMEARVDIGEMDVVLIESGQTARLEIDAFRDRKFTGTVTEIANSAKGSSALSGGSSGGQDATKFEVRIRVNEKEVLRPGMSVTAEVETRQRTNVLTVPIASVTTRPPKANKTPADKAKSRDTNSVAGSKSSETNSLPGTESTNRTATADSRGGKSKEEARQVEVVFVIEGDHVRMAPVKLGISDEDYYEITEGLNEGEEVVSGSHRAIRDLQDEKKVVKGTAADDTETKKL
jgi:HlyD family secretion protein